jgi:nicotinamidase-related amidase
LTESIRLYRGTDMAESEPVTWRLAPGYLAAGKVNLLVGDEGIGKSLWTIRAIASITTGKPWGPFTIASDPVDVILIATEDGWSDTIRPRLEVAEADIDRVYVFSQSTDGTGPPTFPKDMEMLRNQPIKPSLVVVDAWIDTVPGGLPVKDTQKARGAVAPWKSYAADTNAAVLLVAHTNRGDRDNLRNTYGLSVALRQVACSTLYAAEVHDTSALLVGPDKSNLGARAMAERFERTPVQHFPSTDQNDGTVARLDYLGTDGRTITDALADQLQDKQPERKTDAIDNWLRAALASGAVRSTDLEERAKEQGYTTSQLHRSRTRVKARAFRVDGEWFTEL